MSSPINIEPPAAHRPDLTLACGLLLLALGLGAAGIGVRAYLGLNEGEPLLAGLPAGGAHQREQPPPRQVRHLVLIIADGLTAELALGLPPIRELAARGIWADAEAPGPSLSLPSYVTWLAGLDPVDSGVRTNRYHGVFPLDSLPSRARAGGLHSLGYDSGHETKLASLFGPHLSLRLSGPEAWPEVLRSLPRVDLALLALVATDEAGHAHGAASLAYRAAAEDTARRIAEVTAALDLRQDLLVVLNDHGHLPAGGHGGLEPAARRLFLVAAGAALGHGRQHIDQKDLAPTLAHLLGLLPPAHNRGYSLGWALDPRLDPLFYEAAFASQYSARHRVERYLAGELGVALPPGRHAPRVEDLVRATVGNLDEARRLGWHTLQLLQHRVDRGRLARLSALRLRRSLWVGVPLLLALAVIVAGRRLGVLRVRAGGALLAVLPLAATVAGLYLLDVRPSFSQAGTRGLYLARVAGAAGGAALLHLLLAYVIPGPSGRPGGRASSLGRLLAGAWLFSTVALAGYALIPTAPGSALPDGRLLAGAFLGILCWVVYLLVVGLLLTLSGLRRPADASTR